MARSLARPSSQHPKYHSQRLPSRPRGPNRYWRHPKGPISVVKIEVTRPYIHLLFVRLIILSLPSTLGNRRRFSEWIGECSWPFTDKTAAQLTLRLKRLAPGMPPGSFLSRHCPEAMFFLEKRILGECQEQNIFWKTKFLVSTDRPRRRIRHVCVWFLFFVGTERVSPWYLPPICCILQKCDLQTRQWILTAASAFTRTQTPIFMVAAAHLFPCVLL